MLAGLATSTIGLVPSLAPIGYRAPATVPLRLQANAEPFERAHTPTRRALLTGAAAALLTSTPALAKIESINPANNYYFPMAKYRYLPRIFRSWIAIDELAPQAIKDQDWEALQEVWVRADDSTTCLPLYTSAVEGSRSTKRKKKSDAQKELAKVTKEYKAGVEDFKVAVDKKDIKKATTALAKAHDSLEIYRQIAQIDTPDGGIVELPVGDPQEAGHGGAPLGYVVPALRGGGTKPAYDSLKAVKNSGL